MDTEEHLTQAENILLRPGLPLRGPEQATDSRYLVPLMGPSRLLHSAPPLQPGLTHLVHLYVVHRPDCWHLERLTKCWLLVDHRQLGLKLICDCRIQSARHITRKLSEGTLTS